MFDRLITEGIFIIHALKGYEYHAARIEKIFREKGLMYEFVTDGDPAHLNESVLANYFVSGIEQKFSLGVISCTLNHMYAYEKMVARGLEYAIVFENDPYFLGDFTGDLKKYYKEIEDKPRGFIVSLENSTLRFPSFWETRKGKYLYQARSGRMAGAYLIDLEGAKRILEDLKTNKCDAVIDWWHNNLIDRGIINMYWAHPPLVEQGSHNGFLSSTISSKPSSKTRRLSWLMQKAYKSFIRRMFNEDHVIEKRR